LDALLGQHKQVCAILISNQLAGPLTQQQALIHANDLEWLQLINRTHVVVCHFALAPLLLFCFFRGRRRPRILLLNIEILLNHEHP